MGATALQLSLLADMRLADHALAPSAAWLWSADARRVLWANPVAAAIFDAASPAALAQRTFEPTHPSAAQVARLADTLPQGGVRRLERLRGFGGGFGVTSTCLCSRITLADNTAAILVVAIERADKKMTLGERAQRLIADAETPVAVFSADGELIATTDDARGRMSGKHDLAALGAEALAREASHNGHAEGAIASGHADIVRLGAGATVALLVTFTATAALEMRKQPFRFVWQMDAATQITAGFDNFAKLTGPKTAALLHRPWAELAETLQLDGGDAIAHALAKRDTWSGITVNWPVDDSDQRVAIEMSGLPVFDRDRHFAGYRGFGVCRQMPQHIAPSIAPPPEKIPEPDADAQAANASTNVLAFSAAAPVAPSAPRAPPAPSPTLSPGEHSAFEELARELNARLKAAPEKRAAADHDVEFTQQPTEPPRPATPDETIRDVQDGRPILDRLPIGILVYRLNNLIYANRAFLDWTGYGNLQALEEAGGLDSLFIETSAAPDAADNGKSGGKSLTINTVNGKQKSVAGRLFSMPWNQENALVLMINTQGVSDDSIVKAEASLRRLENENHELRAVLDTATDGVLVLDRAGRVLSANRSAQALFGYDAADFTDLSLSELLAPESRRSALDYLERLAGAAGERLLDTGREAIGRVRRGGLVPLFITMGRIEGGDRFCAVLRDITAWKRTEEELINARHEAERTSTAKSEFLAKISHEIRTPLNAIIGFSEVMMDERFGAIGNERYKQYLKDIHGSGGHLISLLNELIDLSKIEAGKLDLTFVSVDLNEIVQQCVAMLQQQANRERVIIRTSLPTGLPPIVADARSVRQIALNLLSNSIKYTGAGGQVIVSTALNDDNEASLRVRDTGVGMSEHELQTALEPFRQLATSSRWGASGTGLGLPITKALAEANHARFRITSQPDNGTLVEVAFPATRVLAE